MKNPIWLLVLATMFACAGRQASAAVALETAAPVAASVGATDMGPAPASLQLRMALTLNYRNEAVLEQLLAVQQNPRSPLYHHFLSNAQFNASFAPDEATYGRVVQSLRAAGFSITGSYNNRTVVDAQAPKVAVERYFHTRIHRVDQPGYGIRYANVDPAVVPTELRGLIAGVDGLHDLTVVHSNHVFGHRLLAPETRIGGALHGPDGGFGPAAFARAYDFPVQHPVAAGSKQTYDGRGRTVANVIDADFLESDLAGYLQYFGVTRTGPPTVRVYVDGGPPRGEGSPDWPEPTLDVETIVSLAPGVALYAYEFPDFSNLAYITDAYNLVVSQNRAGVVNSSFGGCEPGVGPDAARAWNRIFMQGAAKGITFSASTGDNGARGCGDLRLVTQAPADSPYNVAVGGSSLTVTSTGSYQSESAWAGGGGGVSTIFPVPDFQKGVAHVIQSGRNTPDVAFDGDPSTGESFYGAHYWQGPIGGTSLSSPINVALLSEFDQLENSRAGRVNEHLYGLGYKHNGVTLFHDIVTGSNGYNAGPGYDQATGIGSLDGWNVANQL